MNELEEMKRLADEIVAEGEAFCRRMKEHDRRMEREHRENIRLIDIAAGNYKRIEEAVQFRKLKGLSI